MPTDERDPLELLKAELSFIEKGGYGRSVRTPSAYCLQPPLHPSAFVIHALRLAAKEEVGSYGYW